MLVIGKPVLGSDEHAEDGKPKFDDVQYAVETLIESGWAGGSRDVGNDGVCYKSLKLTAKGEGEAIRGKRKRDKDAEAMSALRAKSTE